MSTHSKINLQVKRSVNNKPIASIFNQDEDDTTTSSNNIAVTQQSNINVKQSPADQVQSIINALQQQKQQQNNNNTVKTNKAYTFNDKYILENVTDTSIPSLTYINQHYDNGSKQDHETNSPQPSEHKYQANSANNNTITDNNNTNNNASTGDSEDNNDDDIFGPAQYDDSKNINIQQRNKLDNLTTPLFDMPTVSNNQNIQDSKLPIELPIVKNSAATTQQQHTTTRKRPADVDDDQYEPIDIDSIKYGKHVEDIYNNSNTMYSDDVDYDYDVEQQRVNKRYKKKHNNANQQYDKVMNMMNKKGNK